ncbi:MAG: hypothetical protein HQL34_08725 [Alphaproteobacteria bacterium]|nr:hypothetical protein [Alphaproteobacteria bacterium]
MIARAVPALVAVSMMSAVGPAFASDVSDVAREQKLPVEVVESVLGNIDAFFASPEAPSNRMTSGLFKELALKAVKARMGSLEESGPGKASDASSEEKNATYSVSAKTTRHETTETGECVDNKVTATSSEGVPVVREGAFTFDLAHPKVGARSWTMSFCRTPVSGGTGYSDWKLSPKAK